MNPYDPDPLAESIEAEFDVDDYRFYVLFAPTEEWPSWVRQMRAGRDPGQSRFLLPGMDYGRVMEEAELRQREEKRERDLQYAELEQRRREAKEHRAEPVEDDWEFYERTGQHR